jgi:hypothetical protein
MNPIDITKELDAFEKHVELNERTILSARFGDGKTYFLNEFKNKYPDKYEFITLYPVNYQVADNKEIFEYIKRDILIQIIQHKMIDPDCKISEFQYFQSYILNNGKTLLQDIIQILPMLGGFIAPDIMTTLMAGFKGMKFLEDQKEKYEQFKNDIDSMSDIKMSDKFCTEFSEEKGGLYELDMITSIIVQSLQKYKENQKENQKESKKKIVLIIEDMDRLDPAHLFRLLNIFSAHFDRYNLMKDTEDLDKFLLSNKFGFDKIITVFDYDNVKKIFNHFYGNEACFEGYINKFTSSLPFRYSIKISAIERLKEILTKECKLKIEDLKKSAYGQSVSEILYKLSVRDICKIIDNYEIHIKNEYIKQPSGTINSICSLTKFMSILHLAGIKKDNIINTIEHLPASDKLNCIGPFLQEKSIFDNDLFCYENQLYRPIINIHNNIITDIEYKYEYDAEGEPLITHRTLSNIIKSAIDYIYL